MVHNMFTNLLKADFQASIEAASHQAAIDSAKAAASTNMTQQLLECKDSQIATMQALCNNLGQQLEASKRQQRKSSITMVSDELPPLAAACEPGDAGSASARGSKQPSPQPAEQQSGSATTQRESEAAYTSFQPLELTQAEHHCHPVTAAGLAASTAAAAAAFAMDGDGYSSGPFLTAVVGYNLPDLLLPSLSAAAGSCSAAGDSASLSSSSGSCCTGRGVTGWLSYAAAVKASPEVSVGRGDEDACMMGTSFIGWQSHCLSSWRVSAAKLFQTPVPLVHLPPLPFSPPPPPPHPRTSSSFCPVHPILRQQELKPADQTAANPQARCHPRPRRSPTPAPLAQPYQSPVQLGAVEAAA